ncbi:MscS Mechanosensitive ion channel [Nitrosococcus oceani ATCC 19707]|uniref:Small-conductance mechanosensitive channel n=2 Tax=Nitrosococcus oceani TaxID=1229 RepID=Q3J9W8_NITOC|nr:mechanosensitive ion channel domain-containing protein [Nitrosococcus oceani]ABA58378.1 MscS Mechanosensitive ion channel [Nitrosococcus oceani ATCC 19707]EDZ68149.1 transporter, MscS family [Nitrosococcus oceani AFC27]KFI19184.1 mechanosensitive ion channel protein MscS [Nitrosococcus oceani C-27]GEM18769.1 mechanosensitive ion channel protein MscS [Nitrosococcus oceani]
MPTETIADIFQDPSKIGLLQVFLIIVLSWLLLRLIDWFIPWLAERLAGGARLYLLPSMPILKFVILIIATTLILPLLIDFTLKNLITVLGAIGLALGFAFKDYVSSIIAGIVAIYERTYRPGDWVKIDQAYGEVRSSGLRALKVLTPDDTIVTIPHAKLWDTNIYNDNTGARDLLCVADFYLDPRHEAHSVREALYDVALTSIFVQLDHSITVIVAEKPWGTHYRLKAYPMDGRDQFLFTSDLTVRGKAALAALGTNPAQGWPALQSGSDTTSFE